jgi:hypothetical protein
MFGSDTASVPVFGDYIKRYTVLNTISLMESESRSSKCFILLPASGLQVQSYLQFKVRLYLSAMGIPSAGPDISEDTVLFPY